MTTTTEAQLTRLLQATGSRNDVELSEKLGLTPQTVYNARKKEKVPPAWFFAAAQAFSVSADWLFFGDPAEKDVTNSVDKKCDVDSIFVPRVKARLAAGTGSLETSADVQGLYAFRSDWIHRKGQPSSMVLFDVTGDSMSPELKHGDMVLVDQSKQDIVQYGYYAVGVEDAVFVKQLRIKPGKLILHSLNPSYDDIEVDIAAEQPECVRIIGRVIWTARELV